MDKFKNLFTDEEIIEEEEIEPIEIKEVKKEEEVHKLPTFMREKIEKEQQEKLENLSEVNVKKDLKLENKIEEEPKTEKIEEKNTFKFPIDFTDNDFVETRSRQSIHNKDKDTTKNPIPAKEPIKVERSSRAEPKVAELYKDKKREPKEKERKFQATPIISPIYGVLDKNYTSGEVENNKGKNLEDKRHSKNVDFDSVRKKAYGSLSEEIKENLICENCEYLKEAKECQKTRSQKREENLVYDVIEEDSNTSFADSNSDITLDEATENYYDYGVEYEKKQDSYNEEVEEVKIVNHEETERPRREIPPVKSSINLLSTLKKSMGDDVAPSPKKDDKDLELTDDLFNLIDSMYDERNETND